MDVWESKHLYMWDGSTGSTLERQVQYENEVGLMLHPEVPLLFLSRSAIRVPPVAINTAVSSRMLTFD